MNNPIIVREFVSLLRTRKAGYLLVTVALVSSALVLLRWPSDALVDLAGNQARHVFRLFGYGMLTTTLLLVPIFPSTSIVREKNSGTLALLFNSPLRSWKVFLGKLLGTLGFLALLMLMSLPAAAAISGMGSVSFTGEVLVLYGLLALACLEYAALSLLVSSYAGTSESALRWTYAWVLLLSVLTLAPNLFLQGRADLYSTLADWIRCLSPIPAVMELLGHADVTSQGFLSAGSVTPRFLMLAPLAVAGFSIATIRRLNFRIFDRARSQGIMTHERTAAEQTARRVMFLFFFDPQRRKSGIAPLVNPVMVKEFRCRRFGRAHWLLRLAAVSILVSLLLTLAATTATMERGVEKIGAIMVVLQVALVVLLTPSMASSLISGERESGGWVLLQMTPLTAGRILVGKLMSVLWTVLLILISTLPGYIIIVWIDRNMWLQVKQVIICLLWTAAFSLTLSAMVSAFCRRTAVSTTVTYILLLLVYAGTMLIWIGRDAPFGHNVVENVLRINPMAAALNVIQVPEFTQYQLLPINWWIMGISTLMMLMILYTRTRRLMQPG
jgi:ABC-type transport system involved in multi-copper enzyme maturation permease subunit